MKCKIHRSVSVISVMFQALVCGRLLLYAEGCPVEAWVSLLRCGWPFDVVGVPAAFWVALRCCGWPCCVVGSPAKLWVANCSMCVNQWDDPRWRVVNCVLFTMGA